MKIENFTTGVPLDPNLENLYILIQKIILKIKNMFVKILKNIAESSLSNYKENLKMHIIKMLNSKVSSC